MAENSELNCYTQSTGLGARQGASEKVKTKFLPCRGLLGEKDHLSQMRTSGF